MSLKTRLFFLFLIMGATLTILGVKDLIILSKDPINLMEEDYDDLQSGDHVILDVTAVFPAAISVTETTKTMGVTTSSRESKRFYTIPYLHEEKVNGLKVKTPYPDALLLVQVGSNYFDKMEKALDDTYDWMNEWYDISEAGKDLSRLPSPPVTGIKLEGSLKKLNKESLGYAIEYAEEIEDIMWDTVAGKSYSAEDCVIPYYLEPIMVKSAPLVMTIIGLVMLIGPGVMIVLYFKQKKEEQEMRQAVSRSVSKETYGPGTGDEQLARNANVGSMVAGAFAQPAAPVQNAMPLQQGGTPQTAGSPYAQPASPYAQPTGMAGTAQPLGAGGTAQPIGMAGTAQPIGATGTAQPLGATGTAQPIGAGGMAQPMGMSGTAQPVGPTQSMGPSQPTGSPYDSTISTTPITPVAASQTTGSPYASPITPVTPVNPVTPVTPVTPVNPVTPAAPAQPAEAAQMAQYFNASQPVQLPYSSGVAPSAAEGNTTGLGGSGLNGGGSGL